MKEKIRLLIELQDCDNRIKEIVNKKNEGPLRVQRLKDDLAATEKQFQEQSDRLDMLKKERRNIEREVQEVESKIEKSTVKLSNIKSNKEYTAALKEIEDLKNIKFSTEDRVIQIMEETEELERISLEHKDRRTELATRVDEDIAAIEKKLSALGKELRKLEVNRLSLTGAIDDKDVLKTYLLLRDRKGGQAISSVIRGVCQTCHLGFPPQKFNELMRGNSLLTCPNCNRIIYWGEDEHFQNVSDKL